MCAAIQPHPFVPCLFLVSHPRRFSRYAAKTYLLKAISLIIVIAIVIMNPSINCVVRITANSNEQGVIFIVSSENFLNLMLSAADKKSDVYIEDYVRRCLTSLIKQADSDVNRLFFPAERGFIFTRMTLLTNEELSARYILYVVSGLQQRPDLAALVSEKSYRHVSNFLQYHAKSIGEMIFSLYLAKHLTLPEAEDKRDAYFNDLEHRLITSNFKSITKAVSISHSPAPAQLILSALKLLDSGVFHTVLLSWAQSEFFSKEFADLDLLHLLENYPWLEAYHADILSGHFTDSVIQGAKNDPVTVKQWIEKGVNRYCLF